jgi:chloramphenicol 3-O phosphotransferase
VIQEQGPGQIIILNGTPRSGKSSIVAVIQNTFDGVWMNLGVDRFMQMTPAKYLPGIGLRPGGERQDIESLVTVLYRALYDSIAVHSRLGLNVVVDVGHHDDYAIPRGILPDSARRLTGLPVLFVGVRCPIEIIMERRRATGWDADNATQTPVPQPIRLWQEQVHIPGIYDLEVDTSILSPEACAATIRHHLAKAHSGSVFEQLARMTNNTQVTARTKQADNDAQHNTLDREPGNRVC